jgi:hypothetical protein
MHVILGAFACSHVVAVLSVAGSALYLSMFLHVTPTSENY